MTTWAAFAGVELPDDAAEDSFESRSVLLAESYESPVQGPVIATSARGYIAIRQGPWKLTTELEGRLTDHPVGHPEITVHHRSTAPFALQLTP